MIGLQIIGTLSSAAAGGGGSFDTEFDVTISSGTVGSDLTDFPVMIDMRDMPPAFWIGTRSDGGNIRAYAADGTTQIPIDVTFIDVERSIGRMFVKHSLAAASDTTFKIVLLDASQTMLATTDPNGRNAVWADYEVVWVFPSKDNRTGNAFTDGGSGPVEQSKWIREAYYDMTGNPHQGIAVDASGNVVTIDTDYLRRHSTSDLSTLLASNGTPVSDIQTETGDSAVNHLSDGCIIAGELWVPANEYPNSGDYNEYLCVFDIATLSIDRAYDVSAVGRHVSGICYNPADGLIYATDYTDGSSLMKFATDGTYMGTVSLSSTLDLLQGIEVVEGKFYLSSGTADDYIQEVEFDGTVNGPVFKNPQSGLNEGISYAGELLYHMDGDGDLTVLKAREEFADWGRFHYTSLNTTYPRSTVWTMAVSVYWQIIDGDLQQAFATMANGSSSSNWATITYDEGPDLTGMWNSSDGWIYSADNPAFKDLFRVAGQHDGTTERQLFLDGAVAASDAGCAAKPSGSGSDMSFIINASTTLNADDGEGYYQFAWARNEYMSEDWMAADAANMADPSSFYSIVAA